MPRPPVKASQLSPNPGSASCRHAGVELNLPESPPLWPPSPRGAAGLPQPPSLRTPQASHTEDETRARGAWRRNQGGAPPGLGTQGLWVGEEQAAPYTAPPHRQGTAVPGVPSGAQDGQAPRGSTFFLCWGRPPSFSSTPGAAPDSENHFSDAASPAKPGCVSDATERRPLLWLALCASRFLRSALMEDGKARRVRSPPRGQGQAARPPRLGGELRFSQRGSDRHLPGGSQVPPPPSPRSILCACCLQREPVSIKPTQV